MSDMASFRQMSRLRLDDIGHSFRGAFIDKCAQVERWASAVVAHQDAPAKFAKEKALFGQWLKAVRSIAVSDRSRKGSDRIVRRPNRVIALLDRFQPHADLRAVLAHSTQQVNIAEDGTPVFLYRPFNPATLPVELTQEDQRTRLRELHDLAKLINDQPMSRRT